MLGRAMTDASQQAHAWWNRFASCSRASDYCAQSASDFDELLDGDDDFVACFLASIVNGLEFFLDLFQDCRFEVLLAAAIARLTWHLVDHQEFAFMAVDVLHPFLGEVTFSTEIAGLFHDQPRSNGVLNFGGPGTYTVMITMCVPR
jgi:hypothetical protein